MDSQNYPTATADSPMQSGAVWPPPPSQSPQFVVPFKNCFRRIDGSVSDFRTGSVALGADGVLINGKAIMPYEKQMWILIPCLILRLGWVIAACILEYGVRNDYQAMIPWMHVQQIVLNRKKSHVCLLYDYPNYKQVVKKFSLAFSVDPANLDNFMSVAAQYVPDRVVEGKLKSWTSPPTMIFAILLLIGLLVGIGVGIFEFMKH